MAEEIPTEAKKGKKVKKTRKVRRAEKRAFAEACAKAACDAGAPWAREAPEGGLTAKKLKKLPVDYRLTHPDPIQDLYLASGVACDFPNAKVSSSFFVLHDEFVLIDVQDYKIYQCSDWVANALSEVSSETTVDARLSTVVDSDSDSD